MSFTNQKLPKGKEYWGVKDRLKETEGDTHTETQRDTARAREREREREREG
jgi:hypothetical protein